MSVVSRSRKISKKRVNKIMKDKQFVSEILKEFFSQKPFKYKGGRRVL